MALFRIAGLLALLLVRARLKARRSSRSTIVTASAGVKFQVEVMRNDERARPRPHVPARNGRRIAACCSISIRCSRSMIWMKNTYLPLDMIFIAREGCHRQHRREHRAAVGNARCLLRRPGLCGAGGQRRAAAGVRFQGGRSGRASRFSAIDLRQNGDLSTADQARRDLREPATAAICQQAPASGYSAAW
jgi:hypothetical protein